MKVKKHFETIILSNDEHEVRIQKKIFGGYILRKYLANSAFGILESREIHLNISEEEVIELGKELLEKVYKTSKPLSNLKYIPNS